MNKIESFVVPIMGQAQQGCGFFVGNYFITAGHVLEESKLPLSIIYDGKQILLNESTAIEVNYSKELTGDESETDFALFALNGINSPLKLADYKPSIGQELRCFTYDTVVYKDETPNIPAIFANREEIVTVDCKAVVREEALGNFFACDINSILKKGNSGCPVIDSDNNVVGILRGGTHLPECCIFQYAYVIKALIG